MPFRPVRWSSLAGIACIAACAGVPPAPGTVDAQWSVPLPPATAAAIAAGALRNALPFADPVRSSRGAPVQHLAPDHFRVTFVRGAGDAWLPCATHRLTIVCTDTGSDAALSVRIEPLAADERAVEAPASSECDLHVRGHGAGSIVSGCVPADLLPALDNAFALVLDPCAALPGLAEPNLRAFVVHRLRCAAAEHDAHDEPGLARELRQRAGLLGDQSAELQQSLGDEAALTGDAANARDHYWQALAVSQNAGERAALAARLCALPRSDSRLDSRPVAWRRAAREALRGNDSFGAMSLLHTARRQLGDPATDYRLLSQLHHQRADEMAAFASALLAREHAGADEPLAAFAAELWQESGGAMPGAPRTTATATTNGAQPPRLVPAFATPIR